MDHKRYIVALREFGQVGPKRFQQLLLHFGSLENIFSAELEELASLPRLSVEKAAVILEAESRLEEADKLILAFEANDIHVATVLDDSYPELLTQIGDPPPVLYYRGEFPVGGEVPAFAIVGPTEAKEEAIARAVALGKKIAQKGGVVISGLARGIDAAAHLGALAEGGKTFAVLGSGLEAVYPPENISLAESITKSGALVSEYTPFVEVEVGQLIARNRIIVGLSRAVILVDEPSVEEKGSDAANRALDLGRPLFVMAEGPKKEYWRSRGAIPLKGNQDLDSLWEYL